MGSPLCVPTDPNGLLILLTSHVLEGAVISWHVISPSCLTWSQAPALAWIWPLLVVALLAVLAWVFLLRSAVREQTAVFLDRLQRAVREITEYQRTSTELRESEERFRHLAENMRDIVWIVSLDHTKTLFVNSAFEEITGRAKESLYDRPNCLDLVHLDDRSGAVATLFRQVLERYDRDAEFRIVRPDGDVRWLRCRAFSILKEPGRANQVGCIAEDITERRQAEQELRQLSGRLIRLEDEERRRIARELHDSTGQVLAALLMNLGAVQQSAARLGKKARRALAESLDLAKQCSQEVRTVAYLLHPPLLEELGLISALRIFVEGYTRRSGIHVDLEAPADFGRLPQEIELALFRVAQECLTNVHRHSVSPTARVQLAREFDGVRLEVRDEGRGIPPEKLGKAGQVLPGLGVGIAGMQERLRQLGGRLEIASSDRGTTITAIIPHPLEL